MDRTLKPMASFPFLSSEQSWPPSLSFGPRAENSILGRTLLPNPRVWSCGGGRGSLGPHFCSQRCGTVFRILPLYLIYRPANNIPYATLEEDLGQPLQPYCSREGACAAAPDASCSSEVRQKCQTFQHWLYLWTNGSFLVTDLAGRGLRGCGCACMRACGALPPPPRDQVKETGQVPLTHAGLGGLT